MVSAPSAAASSDPNDVVNLTASLSAKTYADASNGTREGMNIPGSIIEYAVTITNGSSMSPRPDSVVVANPIPKGLAMMVTDFQSPAAGPISFTEGTQPSGLSYRFEDLASATDMLEFSANDGASYDYTPVARVDGTDPNVTNIRIRLHGVMAPAGTSPTSFVVRYRMRIN